MNLKENILLKSKNTFGIASTAKYYAEIDNIQDIKELINSNLLIKNKFYILGGGSNTLLPDFYSGIIIKNSLKGIKLVSEDSNSITFAVASGEDWNDFVNYTVDKGFAGIEALALIPGSVGAAPVQNIGAYGQEARNTVVQVKAINLKTASEVVFSNIECKFGYRDSIFKNEFKDKVLITDVTFRLSKNFIPDNIYEEVKKELDKDLTIRSVRDAVIKIRNRKLPNPKGIGNAGSIFKNPFITESAYLELKLNFPDIPSFKTDDGRYKIPAGWLIEKTGWKGWLSDNKNYGVYQNHALIVVNFGNATGKEILELIRNIKQSVFEKYKINLEEEVNIVI